MAIAIVTSAAETELVVAAPAPAPTAETELVVVAPAPTAAKELMVKALGAHA